MPVSQIPDEYNLGAFLLDRHLDEGRSEKVAIIYKAQKYTYRENVEAANRMGNAFLELGVEQETRVMICLPDCPEFIFSYFGAMRIGAVPVPISTMASAQDYRYYLNDSRAKVLVTTSELAAKFAEVQPELKYLRHFIVQGKTRDKQIDFETLLS